MPVIKAVIFDLDGVITSTDEFHYMAWGKIFDNLGIYFDRNDNEKIKGVSRRESFETIAGHVFPDVEVEKCLQQKNIMLNF